MADPALYRAVLGVDPSNARAREQLENVEQSGVLGARRRIRIAGAGGLLALAGVTLWMLLRALARRPKPTGKKRKKKRSATATATTPPATVSAPPKADDTATSAPTA